jgi:hypothetical protein
MLWIGAIFGALFGWIGILVAALFWATLAIIKLIWALSVFGFQLLLAIGAVLAQAIIWPYRWVSQRSFAKGPAPRAQTTSASTRTAKSIPAGFKPKRKRGRSPSRPDA